MSRIAPLPASTRLRLLRVHIEKTKLSIYTFPLTRPLLPILSF